MAQLRENSKAVRRGVILFNLGGPETLEDVRPFLYNLFTDPEIIRVRTDSLRRFLAWCIVVLRQRKSRELYRQIGGGSPLHKITVAQAAALQGQLEARGIQTSTYVGMRCWKPTIDDAISQIRKDGITHLAALPLFPQYSAATTGSCFKYFRTHLEIIGLAGKLQVDYINSWHTEPLYIEAMARLILQCSAKFDGIDPKSVYLLYSAHSIPAHYVAEGDPYPQQTRETMELINARLGNSSPSILAFQSKLGPVRWLEPSTRKTLKQLGRKGIQSVIAVPLSFVSDHLETLQEMDILYRNLAVKYGIKEFCRVESLNLDPTFIQGLADIVQRSFDPASRSSCPF
jgi:protoporphyrin/coproporphyrin ferrochelatase